MRSFTSALFAVALATLSSAAPITETSASLTTSTLLPLSTSFPSVPLSTGSTSSVDEGGTKSGVTETVDARDVKLKLTDTPQSVKSEAFDAHIRAATLSISAVFHNVFAESQPYTEQMTYLDSTHCTLAEISDIVSPIKDSINAAVPQLQALANQQASAILASADGDTSNAKLSVTQLASIVGGDVNLILGASGHVLDVTNAKGGDIAADSKDLLTDLGDALTSLIAVTVSLVDGLSASLAPVVAPVYPVISDLDLFDLSVLLSLSS